MRESNYSGMNSIQFSDDSSSRKEIEDSVVMEKQVQTFKKRDDEEINLSNVNNINSSIFSVNQSLNMKETNKEQDSTYKANLREINNSNNYSNRGNKINDMMLESNKMTKLCLKQDKEKSEQKGYTIYEISKSIHDKIQILCYRRYDNFYHFYCALKIRYPHYIIPKLTPKKIMAKVYDNQVFLEQRRKELEFFINEIYSHEKIGKGEEIQKFLNNANFDKQYFNSVLKCFDYPETLKKIEENKGIIKKGMKGVSNLYNYIIGNKEQNNNERENAKKIFGKNENLSKKIEKFSSALEEVKNIYKILIEENKEKKFMINNLLFMKSDEINENDIDKKKFNELVETNQKYNFKDSEESLKNFEENIIYRLDFCIFYLNGEQKAIKRYQNFLETYKEIIEYKNINNDKKINIEQNIIKKDIDIYENNLLNEIEKIENKTNKEYVTIIHTLILNLKDSCEDFVELYKDSNFIK